MIKVKIMLQGKFMVNGLHVKKEVSTAIFVRKKKYSQS